MGLLTAPDSALTTKPARIVLCVVSALLRLEHCRHFQSACKSKTDVPCLCHYPSLRERFPRCGFCPVHGPACAQVEGGRCKSPSRQTTDSTGHRGEVTTSSSLRQLNMGWCGEVLLLSPHSCACTSGSQTDVPSSRSS